MEMSFIRVCAGLPASEGGLEPTCLFDLFIIISFGYAEKPLPAKADRGQVVSGTD